MMKILLTMKLEINYLLSTFQLEDVCSLKKIKLMILKK